MLGETEKESKKREITKWLNVLLLDFSRIKGMINELRRGQKQAFHTKVVFNAFDFDIGVCVSKMRKNNLFFILSLSEKELFLYFQFIRSCFQSNEEDLFDSKNKMKNTSSKPHSYLFRIPDFSHSNHWVLFNTLLILLKRFWRKKKQTLIVFLCTTRIKFFKLVPR